MNVADRRRPLAGFVLVAALALFIGTRAAARDYYVDAQGGDDANSGIAASAAWRSIERVNRHHFHPGDVIRLRCGRLWRATLAPGRGGTPGEPVIFTAYGAGPAPVISGSDLVTGWTLVGGAVYGASLAAEAHNVLVDGGPPWGLRHASGARALERGSWYWDRAARELLVWLPDSSSPADHTIEAATRLYGFAVNSGRCDRLSFITVEHLRFERTGGYGIYFHCYRGPAVMRGIVVRDNVVTQTGTGRLDGGQYFNGIFYLQEPPYSEGAPVIADNTVSYTGGHGNGINCQGANHAVIRGNDVSHWNHNGIDVKTAAGVLVERNIAHDEPKIGAGFYAEYSTVTWRDNIAHHTANGFQIADRSTGLLYDNDLYASPTGFFVGPRNAAVTLVRNAVSRVRVAVESDGRGKLASRTNLWGAAPMFRLGDAGYDFARWMALPDRAGDVAADPMWADPAGGDFRPLPGSPCLQLKACATPWPAPQQ